MDEKMLKAQMMKEIIRKREANNPQRGGWWAALGLFMMMVGLPSLAIGLPVLIVIYISPVLGAVVGVGGFTYWLIHCHNHESYFDKLHAHILEDKRTPPYPYLNDVGLRRLREFLVKYDCHYSGMGSENHIEYNLERLVKEVEFSLLNDGYWQYTAETMSVSDENYLKHYIEFELSDEGVSIKGASGTPKSEPKKQIAPPITTTTLQRKRRNVSTETPVPWHKYQRQSEEQREKEQQQRQVEKEREQIERRKIKEARETENEKLQSQTQREQNLEKKASI